MKIPEKNPSLLLEKALLGKTAPKKSSDVKDQAVSRRPAADSVKISNKARHIQQLNALASSGPEIREERVAEIQEKVDAGTYEVDGKRLAEKLIRSTLQDKVS